MTQQELDALQGLCDGATIQPWIYDERVGCVAVYHGEQANCIDDTEGRRLFYADGHKRLGPHGIEWRTNPQDCANAQFIAAARTAMPALIAEVRRLQAENAEALDNYNAFSRDYHDCIAERGVLRERAEALENDLINANMNLGIMTERCEAAEADLATGATCDTCRSRPYKSNRCSAKRTETGGVGCYEWRGPAPDEPNA